MDSADEAPLSLNSGCITADDSAKIARRVIPHHLLPSTGSCHDICKYGRRLAFEEQATKPLHKRRRSKLVPPTRQKRAIVEHEFLPYADQPRKHSHLLKKPSPYNAKSFSPNPKNLSSSGKTTSPTKRGEVGKTRTSCDQFINISTPSVSSWKRRRNEDIQSGGHMRLSMLSSQKAWMPVCAPLSSNKGRKHPRVELLSPHKNQKRVKTNDHDTKCNVNDVDEKVEENQVKFPRIATESNGNGFVFEYESFSDTPSSLSHGEDDEESDILVSDTPTTVSERKKNRNNKRQRRKSRVVRPGDKHCRATKLKFRIGNSSCLHKENNSPTRMHKFRASRNKSKHGSKASKHSRGRVRNVKARVLVLEHRNGGSKSDHEKQDVAGAELLLQKNNLKRQDLQRKRDQCLFNYVIEETASKLAERRKGMVKSLVGAFETLISLQARKCFLSVAR